MKLLIKSKYLKFKTENMELKINSIIQYEKNNSCSIFIN